MPEGLIRMGVRRQLAVAALLAAGIATGGMTTAAPAEAALVATPSAHVQVHAPGFAVPGFAVPGFAAPHKTLKPGMRGAAVKALQQRLRVLGYVPGKIDGRYGGTTQMAVW